MAGFALAGGSLGGASLEFLFTLIGSLSLYGMGMVFNDLAGQEEDLAHGHSHKPLISGEVQAKEAFLLGIGLFLLGNWALLSGGFPILFGGILSFAILAYDFGAAGRLKPVFFWHGAAPLLLGLCRSLNLGLGFFLLKPQLTGWPLPLIFLGSYGLYTLLVGVHGRFEDLGAQIPSKISRSLAGLALLLLVLPPLLLPLPWVGVFLLPSLFFALKQSDIHARTGILLKGFSRFGFMLALGSKAFAIASLCAFPAWILPFFVGKRWT